MTTASLVLFNTANEDINRIISLCDQSCIIKRLFLIDNSSVISKNEAFSQEKVNYIFTNKNLGYGKGHNIAIKKSLALGSKYHFVINPDIYFDPADVKTLVRYMKKNNEIGHIMPKVLNPDKTIQRVAKLLPTPLDMFNRVFPNIYQNKTRNKRYTLHKYDYDKILNVPYLSGCFMLLRMEALKNIGYFDERFFMYPEDMDITRRIHRKYKTIVYPKVSIVHRHEKASSKDIKMFLIFVINMFKYFNKYGWFFDKERKLFNNRVVSQLK